MRLVALLFIAIAAWINPIWCAAQELSDDAISGRPTIGQTGRLFSIQLTPVAKKWKVQVTGKTVATLDPSQITVFGKVFPRTGNPRDLKLKWTGKHYEIQGAVEPKERLQIRVQQKSNNAVETFEIDEDALKPK